MNSHDFMTCDIPDGLNEVKFFFKIIKKAVGFQNRPLGRNLSLKIENREQLFFPVVGSERNNRHSIHVVDFPDCEILETISH